ncbi:hypothetical protein [Nocardia sp. CA-120079]|uniref:hypothetical protein n=1 Tax=Nocardia sp. CA-120079 TaxID=3239974 RepID=UPI003D96AAE4
MGVGTELPQLITEIVEWDVTAQVIVVGFGIAGACAAISAAEAGRGCTCGGTIRRIE